MKSSNGVCSCATRNEYFMGVFFSNKNVKTVLRKKKNGHNFCAFWGNLWTFWNFFTYKFCPQDARRLFIKWSPGSKTHKRHFLVSQKKKKKIFERNGLKHRVTKLFVTQKWALCIAQHIERLSYQLCSGLRNTISSQRTDMFIKVSVPGQKMLVTKRHNIGKM